MAQTPFNILCVGDSLTEGSPSKHPYGNKLRQILEDTFPEYEVECEIQGKEGDQVTQGGFDDRLQGSWAVAERPFDWTIILGGSNDINWNKPADAIIEALEQAWDFPLTEGGKVLAMTIPEYRMKSKRIDDKRAEVNKAILAYENPNFFTFDLFEAFPYHAMDQADREKYWDPDGVHLTAAGYDLMGEKVAGALIDIIKTL